MYLLVLIIISQKTVFINIPNQKQSKGGFMNNFDLELKQIQLQNEKLFRELSAITQMLEKPAA